MANDRITISTAQLLALFPDEEAARHYIESRRWPNGPRCPVCASDRIGQGYAPDYCYFGAHPGNGSDFGFWLCEDWQQMARDDGVLFVNDMSEVPDSYRGMACHVNDHGNATLYNITPNGKPHEIWGVV